MSRIPCEVRENISLGSRTFLLRVLDRSGALAESKPGQFAMLRGADWESDPLLPCAMSIARADPHGSADFLIKDVGPGTQRLRLSKPGETLWILGPLGTAFPDPSPDRRDVLIAGGVGLAPLLMQAEAAARLNCGDRIAFVYGGRSSDELVLQEDIRRTGVALHLATEDGSAGTKGRVTDALDLSGSPTIFACGPTPMLRTIHAMALDRKLPCYLALEETMACGIRACLGCAVPARDKPYLYVCCDGPVFEAREVWP